MRLSEVLELPEFNTSQDGLSDPLQLKTERKIKQAGHRPQTARMCLFLGLNSQSRSIHGYWRTQCSLPASYCSLSRINRAADNLLCMARSSRCLYGTDTNASEARGMLLLSALVSWPLLTTTPPRPH
jgi:hypothetical protein